MTLLEAVSTHLDRAGVLHALIGAAALAAAGVSRSTLDIDLLVVDRGVLEGSFWAGLSGDTTHVEIRRGDRGDPLAGVVRVSAAGERPIDVVVGRESWQQRTLERAVRRPGGPAVVQPLDLVLLKLYAGGVQDLWDVRQLLAADTGPLAEAVETELAALPGAFSRAWRTVIAPPSGQE